MQARAMVLCAGLGTRLRPLTEELPKPLVPLGDRPLLAHIARRLREAGLHDAVLNTHRLPEAFDSVYEWLDVEVKVVHEPHIRGTAGGVAGARRHLASSGAVLVHNGDVLADVPFDQLLAAAQLGGLALGVVPRPAGEGSVGLDGGGNVVRLRRERFADEVSGGDYVGVLGIGARVRARLPETGCLVGDVALPELRRGGVIQSVRATHFSDLGDPARYHAENIRWLFDHVPDRVFVGVGASVAPGVRLMQSVIGHGARVFGNGLVKRCVVWPGAEVRAPLSDAIATRGGHVVQLSSTGLG
jgi:mannose-1-phosphate guanylyltransferase